MNRQGVIVQPQIVHLGGEGNATQVLKVTNKTSQYLDNFFFCLYNQEKFEFTPDSFSLNPNEQKLIQLKLKIKTIRAITKEFAYLKSSQTNNRITILINNQGSNQQISIGNSMQSPEPRAITEEDGLQQAHTFSSRDYRQTQTAAFNKIIGEKQAYIGRLQQQLKQRQFSASRQGTLRDDSRLDHSVNLSKELEAAEGRILGLKKQNENLLQQNLVIHQRFEEYKKLWDKQRNDTQNQKTEIISEHLQMKNQEIQRLYIRIRDLQDQGNEFLRQVQEKQSLGKELERKIQQLQEANKRVTQQIKADNESRIKELERKLENQRQSYQQSFRTYEGKIRELQILASNETSREQVYELERQTKKLTKLLRQEKEARREVQIRFVTEKDLYESQKIKSQLISNQLKERNEDLVRKTRDLESQIDRLRSEIGRLGQNLKKQQKAKVQQQVSEREASIIQMALDSSKNENDSLKRNYSERQKIYTRYQQSSQTRISELEQKINDLHRDIDTLQGENLKISKEKERIEDDAHHELMNAKKENVELLEKIARFNGLDRKSEVQALKEELNRKQSEVIQLKISERDNESKIEELRRENRNLSSKVTKYKKQTRNQLKSLNSNVMEQLKRVHEEKKQLVKKVQELEQSLDESAEAQDGFKSKTGIEEQLVSTVDHMSRNQQFQQECRRVGIKDQRKQLEESRAVSQNASRLSPQQIEALYHQLGELRELESYMRNQQQRLGRILGLEAGDFHNQQNVRSIFRAIRFYKQLESKVKELRDDSEQSNEAVKQLEFMRGRLTELEALKKQNNSSLNLKEKSTSIGAEMMEFLRAEMKNQYTKLQETMRLGDQKYGLLKKKIYQEYRARLISQLDKKDKNSIHQVEATLERFIDGLSNLSHKEAVLSKQVRLKQAARKQNASLKEKVKQLTLLLQAKKGACSRIPVRIWAPESQLDWQENIKLEAQLLTHDAELHRIREQLEISKEAANAAKEQLKSAIEELQARENEGVKLKRQIMDAEGCFEKEIQKMTKKNQQLIRNSGDTLRQKISGKDKESGVKKEKQISRLKRELQTKQQVIKQLKEKERLCEEMCEASNRSDSREVNSKRKSQQENRMRQSLNELRDANRQLRKDNNELKEKVHTLEEQLRKKQVHINSIKGDNEEHRIKVQRKEDDRLQNQIRQLKEQLEKLRDQLDKNKKAKNSEVGRLNDQIKSIKNFAKIDEKSYQSIIRGLLDTLRKIYSALDIGLRNRGKRVPKAPDFESLSHNPKDLDALKVYQHFEEPLNLLESD